MKLRLALVAEQWIIIKLIFLMEKFFKDFLFSSSLINSIIFRITLFLFAIKKGFFESPVTLYY